MLRSQARLTNTGSDDYRVDDLILAYPVPTVICVQAKAMKEPWCLASSTDLPPADLIKLYARRWGIECGFRDAKDPRFGMGMGEIHSAPQPAATVSG